MPEPVTRYVFLYDEPVSLHQIGAGLRKVTAIVGRKWVRVKSAEGDTHRNFIRIRRHQWEQIVADTAKRGLPFSLTP